MKKRILALMLACFMIVSLLPMNAFAVETECPGEGNHAKDNCNCEPVGDPVIGECGGWDYQVYKCLDCEDLFIDDVRKNMYEHEFTEWTGNVATCETASDRTRTCTICGFVEHEDIPALGHDWLTLGGNCKEGLTQQCQNCQEFRVVEADTHNWAFYPSNITLYPDNDPEGGMSNGRAEYTCLDCDATKWVEIFHHNCEDWVVGTWVDADPATCEKEGTLGHFECAYCGYFYDAEMNILESIVDPQKTHEWDPKADHFTVNELVEAVCNKDGYVKYTCDFCGEELEAVLESDSDAHTLVLQNELPATCTTYGFKYWGCVLCGEYYDIEPIAPLNHKDAEGNPTTEEIIDEPTCTEPGTKTVFCYVCNTEVSVEVIPALGHNKVVDEERSTEATCAAVGYIYYKCANGCGEEYEAEELEKDPTNHPEDSRDFETYVPATCDKDGYYDFWCNACGHWEHWTYDEAREETHYLKATGHELVETETPADCLNNGYITITCANGCDYLEVKENTSEQYDHEAIYYRGIDELPEYAALVKVQREATCDYDGLEVYHCLQCGDIFLVVTPAYNHVAPENYEDWVIAPTETTCTTPGHTGSYVCTECGELVEGEAEEAFGHVENPEHVDVLNPTCEDDGHIEYWYCEQCETCFRDAELTQPISTDDPDFILPALGHEDVLVDWYYSDFHNGEADREYSYQHFACKNDCGREYIVNFRIIGEHDFVEVERLDPTCTEGGYINYVCACGETYTEFLDPNGHTHGDFCGNNVGVEVKCEVCGDVCDAPHNFDAQIIHVEATCLNTEYNLYVCLDCGYYYAEPLGTVTGEHKPCDEWVELPSENGNAHTGIWVLYCQVCGEPIETRNEKDVHFTLVADRDLYIVGNTVAVTIEMTGKETPIWGFDLDLEYSHCLWFTGKYEVHSEYFNKIVLVQENWSPEGNYLSIGMNAANDVIVSETTLITLYFEVNWFNGQDGMFTLRENATLTYDGDVIEAEGDELSVEVAMMMDLDRDGVITLADALIAFRLFVGDYEPKEEDYLEDGYTYEEYMELLLILADLDGDGEVKPDEVKEIYYAFLN